MLRLNRSNAGRVLLLARVGAAVGATLTAAAFLAPVSAGTPNLPPPPPEPVYVPQEITRTDSVPFQPDRLASSLNELGPQKRNLASAETGEDTDGENDGSSSTVKQPKIIQPAFKWRYLGRIQTGKSAFALIDTGGGQKLLRQGATLDHPQLGPFTLNEIDRDRVLFAGVSEERELDRVPKEGTVVGSFSSSAPAQPVIGNNPANFAAPTRGTRANPQTAEDRMEERRRRLQELREQRLRNQDQQDIDDPGRDS